MGWSLAGVPFPGFREDLAGAHDRRLPAMAADFAPGPFFFPFFR